MKILHLLILVSLGTASLIGVTSLLSIIPINDIARKLSESETPKVTALYQMEILLEEAAKDIFDFARLEQPPQIQEFQADTNDFKMNASELRRLASAPSSSSEDKQLILLLDDLDKQFYYFNNLGERLISVQENQSEKILERRALLNQNVDPTIDDRLQKDLSQSDPQYAQKQKALLEMEINVHEVFSASSGYIVKRDPFLKERISDSIADFQYWLAHFLDLSGYESNNTNDNSTGLSPLNATTTASTTTIASTLEEQQLLTPTTATSAPPPPLEQQMQNEEQIQYALAIEKDFGTISKLTSDVIDLEDREQNMLVEFAKTETEIWDLLDDKLKSIILQRIQTLEYSADSMVNLALVAIVIAILLAITLGIVISNYITKPIKRLRQAVDEVEAGNLDARVVGINNNSDRDERGNGGTRSNKKDTSSFFTSEELIDLSKSFNSMIKKLKANDRMQSKFLGIASHELRSPIQPILSYADLASKGDIPYKKAIERIFVHALRLQNLANDILDVAKIEAGQLRCVMRQTSVNRVIERALDSIRDNLRKEVALEVQRLEHDMDIELDEERMIQVLTNILGNAAKFTKEGKIKIEISLSSDKRLIEIRISDTGGGIREEIIPQLFERFVTKDVGGSAQQGTGLGLYISKAIVNAHNGTISAFNNPEGGATFVISLPIEQKG